MKNEHNAPENNGEDADNDQNKATSEVRRDAFSATHKQNDADSANEITPEVHHIGEAPQGIDAQPSPSKSKLWIVVGLLTIFLIIIAVALMYTVLNNNRRDAIDVGSADKKETRDQQYKQVDETLKTAFSNSNSTNSSVQPTPPPPAGNANQNPNPNPFPMNDWDKVPNPNPAPTGNVGDALKANNANTETNNSGKIAVSSGGGSSGGNSGNSGNTARPDAVPNRNPQILEVSNPDGRARNYSGASARNQQSSIYYYARNTDGEPTLNKLQPAPNYILSRKPQFNDVFPVRLLGSLHSLGSGGLARMILTRPVEGNGYFLPKGTFFIGRVSGGEGNRLFIALVGYIDPQTQGLVALGGDVNGVDGGLGIKGQRKRLDNRLKKFFGEAWKTSRELGVAYLLGRRGGGNGYGGFDTRIQSLTNSDENKTKEFVVVQSGQEGYIVVSDLPPATEKPNLPNLPIPEKDFIPSELKTLPVDASSVSEADLNTLSNFGEAQIKELLELAPAERERRLQTYSPQLQAILREVLK